MLGHLTFYVWLLTMHNPTGDGCAEGKGEQQSDAGFLFIQKLQYFASLLTRVALYLFWFRC